MTRSRILPIILGLLLLTAGCSFSPKKPPPPDTDASVQQATVLADNGQSAKAIEVLDAAAKLDPASPKPWLKKAQIQFQAADYPSAIQSAEEAAKRDPTNKEARSVAIVSALRIAIRGLVELRGEQDLGENAYAEAQRLASVLKASLGTETLVPADDVNASGITAASPAGGPGTAAPPARKAAPVRVVPRAPVRRAVPPAATVPVDAPAPAPVPPPPPKDSGTDPFKDLH